MNFKFLMTWRVVLGGRLAILSSLSFLCQIRKIIYYSLDFSNWISFFFKFNLISSSYLTGSTSTRTSPVDHSCMVPLSVSKTRITPKAEYGDPFGTLESSKLDLYKYEDAKSEMD